MALKPGSINLSKNPSSSEWTLSMAKAIEDAFLEEWPQAMPGQAAPELNDQMRLIFVAVAKGVVKHLGQNGTAFQVTNANASGNTTHTHTATTTVSVEVDV